MDFSCGILDLFLISGWKIIFSTAIAVHIKYQGPLLNSIHIYMNTFVSLTIKDIHIHLMVTIIQCIIL